MNEIIVVFSMIIVTFIGFLIMEVTGLMKKSLFLDKLPYWFGVGIGAIAFQFFIFSFLAIGWSMYLISLPWLLLLAIYIYNNKFSFRVPFKIRNFTVIERFILLFIILLLIFVGLESVMRPLSAWDGWAIWVLKSRMFYVDDFMNTNVYNLLHENYPYIINLALVFILKMLGIFDDRAILLFFYSFYLFTSLAFFSTLAKYSSRLISLLFTFFLMSTQNFIRHGGRFEAGYADLALGFYIFISSMLIIKFLQKRVLRDLVLLEILLAITALVKEEGIIFSLACNAILLIFLVFKRKYSYIYSFAIFLIPQILWQYFKLEHKLSYSLYTPITFHLERITVIIEEMFKEFLNIKNWNLLWISYAIGIYIAISNNIRQFLIIPILISIQIAVYIVIFMISPHPPSQHIPSVMNRLLLHIAPLAVFYTAIIFSQLTSRKS